MDQVEWQGHNIPDQLEDPSDGETQKPEGQQNQPDDRIEDQRQKRQRPARDEQQTPEYESKHPDRRYDSTGRKFRASRGPRRV